MDDVEKTAAIYEKHKKVMYATAIKILKDPFWAEDAVHNAVLAIMKHLDAVRDVESRNCAYYVITATRHISLNMLRDNHIQTEDIDEYDITGDVNIEKQFEADEFSMLVRRLLDGISIPQRDVLILSLYYEVSTSGISELLGMKHNTVKSMLTRGKKKLQKLLKENGYDK